MATFKLALLAKETDIDKATGRLRSIIGLIDGSTNAFDRLPVHEPLQLVFWCEGDAGEKVSFATEFHWPNGHVERDPDLMLEFDQNQQLGCCVVDVLVTTTESGVHRVSLLFDDEAVWECRIPVGLFGVGPGTVQ
jgi:hypothetical protein